MSRIMLLLLFIPLVFSADVVLYDSTTVSTDLNWLTSTTHKHDVLGWYEESWTGQDKTSNIRVYSSCPDWSTNFPLSNGSNWLIADPIKMENARGIYFNLMYVISKCQMQNTACKETVNIHIKEYDHLGDVRKLDDFNPEANNFLDEWKRHKVLTIEGKDLDQTTFSMKLQDTTKQIRVAFDDNTACTSILSLKVYYAICEKAVHNYTIFDSTISQGASTENNVMVKGKCVDHAVSQNSDEPVAFCGPAGQWTKHIVGGCECLPGYEAARHKGQQICRACPVGFFKSDRGAQGCEECPPNSMSAKEGQAHCVCKRGFYRTVNETAQVPCTQPPTRPKDVVVKYVDETSAEIHWSESAYNGGRNRMWYEWECVRGDCNGVKANPSDKRLYSRVLQLTGLSPGTEYMFNIHAKNDVSEQAGENGASYWPVDVHTKEPSKAVVRNLRLMDEKLNEIRLGWDVDGYAKEFEVEIDSHEHGTKRDKLLTSVPGYTAANLFHGVRYTFKVRAKVHDKWTAWCAPLIYETGKGIAVMVDTSDSIESHHGSSLWYMNIIYIIAALSIVTFLMLLAAYCVCRSGQRNRKQMSDLDALDTYKQDTMTPDYGSGHRQFHGDKFVHQKMNAPLISYGTPVSQPPPYYGGNGTSRFKPYVDPSTYDDPNQALAEFTLEIPPEAVYITTIIGGGEFGDVCMGNLRKSVLDARYSGFDELETVAIKTLKPGSSGKAKMDFLLEASIMGQFAHPNVIRLIGVVTKSEPSMIVTEYMENGSLDHFLRDKDAKGIVLSWRSLVDMLRGIAAGMKYLTDKGYVHRDLAARNVLIDSSYLCKIADFGLSRGVDVTTADAEYTTTGGKIPVRWTAPEAITHRKFTAASDVWSFGVLMWEVCSFGERPYWDWTNQKVITEIMNDYRLPAPMDCPQSLHRLMLWCWKLERHDRPTFTQLLGILEKYTRNPDMIYADSNLSARLNGSVCNVGIYNMTIPRSAAPTTPCPPPPSGSPPIYPQLDDFLKSLGLQHTREKLTSNGVNSVGELARRNHLDLLAMGLISEEYQRIRDALHQLQLSRGLGRPTLSTGTQPRLSGATIRQDEGFFV